MDLNTLHLINKNIQVNSGSTLANPGTLVSKDLLLDDEVTSDGYQIRFDVDTLTANRTITVPNRNQTIGDVQSLTGTTLPSSIINSSIQKLGLQSQDLSMNGHRLIDCLSVVSNSGTLTIDSSINILQPSQVIKINNAEVLSKTALGSTVLASSLVSLGVQDEDLDMGTNSILKCRSLDLVNTAYDTKLHCLPLYALVDNLTTNPISGSQKLPHMSSTFTCTVSSNWSGGGTSLVRYRLTDIINSDAGTYAGAYTGSVSYFTDSTSHKGLWILFDQGQAVISKYMRVLTELGTSQLPDTPPKVLSVWGSNVNSTLIANWTRLNANSDITNTLSQSRYIHNLQNSTAYRYYLVIVKENFYGTSSYNYTSLNEITFYAQVSKANYLMNNAGLIDTRNNNFGIVSQLDSNMKGLQTLTTSGTSSSIHRYVILDEFDDKIDIYNDSASSDIIVSLPYLETVNKGKVYVIEDTYGNAYTKNITIKSQDIQGANGNVFYWNGTNDYQALLDQDRMSVRLTASNNGWLVEKFNSKSLVSNRCFTRALNFTNAVTISTTPFTISTFTTVYLVNTTSLAITINLPSSSTYNGQMIYLKDYLGNSNVNNITINRAGSDLIDGATSYVMNLAYESLTLLSYGSGWIRL